MQPLFLLSCDFPPPKCEHAQYSGTFNPSLPHGMVVWSPARASQKCEQSQGWWVSSSRSSQRFWCFEGPWMRHSHNSGCFRCCISKSACSDKGWWACLSPSAQMSLFTVMMLHISNVPPLAGMVVHSETVSVLVTISITVIVFLMLRIATLPTLKRMVVHSDNHDRQ